MKGVPAAPNWGTEGGALAAAGKHWSPANLAGDEMGGGWRAGVGDATRGSTRGCRGWKGWVGMSQWGS